MQDDYDVVPFNDAVSFNYESSPPLKTPPQSISAEQSVLGGLLLSNEAWFSVAEIVAEADFYSPGHRLIFRSIRSLIELGHPCDVITLSEWLEKEGKLVQIGGLGYLVELAQGIPNAANIIAYADIVRQRSILRQLIQVGTDITNIAFNTQGKTTADLLDYAEKQVFQIAEQINRGGGGFTSIKDVLVNTLDRIDTLFQRQDAVTGVPTGFTDLDEKTSGLQPSDLIIVAGRPSMGKCLAASSEIVLSDGRIATIEEIFQQKQAHLLTLNNDYKLQFTQASEFVDDGIKPVFQVTTRLGRRIETTLTHPFLTLSGWKLLSELQVGDKIAVPRVLPVFGIKNLDNFDWQTIDIASGLPNIVFELDEQNLSIFLQKLLHIDNWQLKSIIFQCKSKHVIRQIQHLLLRLRQMTQLTQIGDIWQLQHHAESEKWSQNDIYWDEIVSIKSVGMKQVYDLTIPETHNFIANDICVHNTSFAMNIAESVAIKEKQPVAVFSMEMPNEQLGMRLISSLGRINQQNVRTGRLEDDDWARITSAISMLSESPLFIDDTPALTPTELRARSRRLAREQGQLGLIVIDYIQLMQASNSRESRAAEVSEISRSLKALAKELHVPIIALSQLNRSLEQRPDKRPRMADLRESGGLEQDADLIVFIYRDEVYHEDSEDKGTAEIIIAKQRNGPIGTVRLTFLGELTRFENYTEGFYGE